MSVAPLYLDYESVLLTGSGASPKVSAQNITVEDFSYGFSDGGSDIGFEVNFGE